MYQDVMSMIGFGAGAAESIVLSQVASATSTAATITVPAGVVAGDLLVMYDRASAPGTTVPTAVTPSGFTLISNMGKNDGTDSARQILSYKLAVGTEASTNVTGMDGTTDGKMMYVFRGVPVIAGVSVNSMHEEIIDTDITAQVVTASAATQSCVVIAGYGVQGSVPGVNPRTMSPAKDGEISSNNTNRYLAYKIYNSSPADVTVDMDDEGTNNTLQSCYLQVA